METINIIDVTVIEPRLKHPTIFENFDGLSDGEAFIIHNDHDPKPLYYQLLGERGNIFKWEYLQEGPEYWKVKIEKLKAGEQSATIGELVASDYRKAEVFKKFGLDFCCGGKKTLAQACKSKGIDVLQVEKELDAVDTAVAIPSEDYNNWNIGFLVDYILNTHHRYIKQAIPVIYDYTQKVARVHGDRHPEAKAIAEKFLFVTDELNRHICKEEEVLFPYIKHLAIANDNGMKVEASPFGSVEAPIAAMEHEHDIVGEMMEEIKKLANNYVPPADACTTYKLSYLKLQEFEDDLHKHIHLENNILFPKAAELEKELQ
jgi:regulator of cell morphogenesis and NO signaling